MAAPNTSEKSNALDREENITRGALSAKRVALYTYDSNTDTLLPYSGAGSTNYTTRIAEDSGDSNLTYIGKAAIGSATSSAVWQIQKIDETTGMVITWGGTGAFDNIWNNRESLSYS